MLRISQQISQASKHRPLFFTAAVCEMFLSKKIVKRRVPPSRKFFLDGKIEVIGEVGCSRQRCRFAKIPFLIVIRANAARERVLSGAWPRCSWGSSVYDRSGEWSACYGEFPCELHFINPRYRNLRAKKVGEKRRDTSGLLRALNVRLLFTLLAQCYSRRLIFAIEYRWKFVTPFCIERAACFSVIEQLMFVGIYLKRS